MPYKYIIFLISFSIPVSVADESERERDAHE